LVGDGDLAEIARLVAREHPVEIVGVLPLPAGSTRLDLDAGRIDGADAIMITALSDARAVYEAALAVFSAERVHVPALLRVPAAGAVAVPAAPRDGAAP
jgi:hypothetical protein